MSRRFCARAVDLAELSAECKWRGASGRRFCWGRRWRIARGLADLLGLVFEYDAARVLSDVEAHNVMARYAARDVIRMLARLVLDGGACTPERFSEMVTAMKAELDIRGRELFHPLRLALAGRAGEGDLDRVILLIDAAAEAGFAVKTVRERMVEFCSVME